MQLKDLHIFAMAARTKNLRAAAEVLGITQPAISKSIRRLELALGAKLFERTTRGVALTQFGHAVYARSKSIESMVDLIHTEVADLKAAKAGLIRLGTSPLVVDWLTMPALAPLIAGDSAIKVDLQQQLSARLLRDLEAGLLDMAIGTIPAHISADLRYERLGTFQNYIVARRNHPILKRPFTLADLAQQKWMMPPQGANTQRVADAFAANNLAMPSFTIQVDSTPGVFASLVAKSDLITIMTEEMLSGKAAADLVPLPSPAPTWEFSFGLFWRRQATLSAAMKRCRVEVKKAFTARQRN